MLLSHTNPYAEKYRHMQEVLDAAERDATAVGQTVPTLSIRFSNPRHADPRTYNRPTATEVAVVFVSEDGMSPSKRDIVQHPREGPLRRVSEMNCHLDPMSYPMLYWNPECQGMGWHPGLVHRADMQTQTRTRLTIEQYYAFYRMQRDDNVLPHGAGRLFQQWAVDAY